MSVDVTRLEIADLLDPVFASGTAGRDALLAAVDGTRPEVVQVLQRLPERQFTSLRQVWEHLPHVPIGVCMGGHEESRCIKRPTRFPRLPQAAKSPTCTANWFVPPPVSSRPWPPPDRPSVCYGAGTGASAAGPACCGTCLAGVHSVDLSPLPEPGQSPDLVEHCARPHVELLVHDGGSQSHHALGTAARCLVVPEREVTRRCSG